MQIIMLQIIKNIRNSFFILILICPNVFAKEITNLSWNKEEMRKNVGHLFLFMKGTWQYSDNGIDWVPAVEEFKEIA